MPEYVHFIDPSLLHSRSKPNLVLQTITYHTISCEHNLRDRLPSLRLQERGRVFHSTNDVIFMVAFIPEE